MSTSQNQNGETGSGSGGGSANANPAATPLIAVHLGGIRPFDPKGDPHSISPRWKKWKRTFELYILGKGVVADEQKTALLLFHAGPEVQEVYDMIRNGADTEDFKTD